MKRKRGGEALVATTAELAASALRCELFNIRATPYRGDILLRTPGGHGLVLQLTRGKGALPPPVLQALAIPPPLAGPASGTRPPLAVLVTTHTLDEMAWVAAAGYNILITGCQPEPPSVMILKALAAITQLDAVAPRGGGGRGAGELMNDMNPQQTPGVAVNAAAALRQVGAYQEAMRLYSDSLGMLAGWLGAEHPAILELRLQCAQVMAHQGVQDGAEREFQAVYEKRLVTLGPGHPATQYAFAELAQARNRCG